MSAVQYLNPFTADPINRPEFLTAHVRPVAYRGFLIVRRLPNSYELVKDGVCLTMRAGGGELRSLADALLGDASDHPAWLVERARDIGQRHSVTLKQAA